MTKYFTADTHFGHANLLNKMGRTGFASIEEHDDLLMANINRVVGVQDELFILGDFAWDKPGKYRSLINCKNVRLILGNHDKHEKSRIVFGETPTLLEIKLKHHDETVRCTLCHYPLTYWPASHHGAIHVYGHLHAQREQTFAENKMFDGRRSMDVGMDNAKLILDEYEPFSEEFILRYLLSRPGHDPVSFYRGRDTDKSVEGTSAD